MSAVSLCGCSKRGRGSGFDHVRWMARCVIVGSVSLLLFTYLLGAWRIDLSRYSDDSPRFQIKLRLFWNRPASNPSVQDVDRHVNTKSKTFQPGQPRGEALVMRNNASSHGYQSANQPAVKYPAVEPHVRPTVRVPAERPNSQDISLSERYVPFPLVKALSCPKLIQGDKQAIQRAEQYHKSHSKQPLSDAYYSMFAANCAEFVVNQKYTTHHITEEERGFPIAFSIVVFKDVEQVERLLRAIYRPQNYYCIHIDSKAKASFYEALGYIASCFPNVFLSSRRVDVQWGWFSVVEPELVCMEDLWKHKKWKYFINLTGQEFPLKTNYELVRILKALNGANNAEGTVKWRNKDRTSYVHYGYHMPDDLVRKQAPPGNMTLTKGSVHLVAQRGFIDYVLHNKTALEFREWVQNTGTPDETFFSSLNHSPHLRIPGAYKGNPETQPIDYDNPYNPFIARFKNWGNGVFNWPCHGERVRLICVFGVGDLELLTHRRELFANKFYLTYQPLALDCLEEWHYNRTRGYINGGLSFDEAYYHKLSYALNHVP